MGIFSFLKAGKEVGDAISSPIEAVGNTFDKLFTSDDERAQAKIILEKIKLEPQILQAEINKLEVQHRSVFVAGWRPFIGWVCGVGLGIQFVLSPCASWVCAFLSSDVVLPQFNGTGDLINLLLAMLGMAGIRSWEKSNKLTK